MRPFFAFLGLLFCLTPIRADEQMVIKDSDAIRNVGRYVEVCGLVVSVTISPFGTAYINFGREYPNQSLPGSLQPIQELGPTRSQNYKGKTSASSAQIELHKGKPEIKIMSMYQIVVLSTK